MSNLTRTVDAVEYQRALDALAAVAADLYTVSTDPTGPLVPEALRRATNRLDAVRSRLERA